MSTAEHDTKGSVCSIATTNANSNLPMEDKVRKDSKHKRYQGTEKSNVRYARYHASPKGKEARWREYRSKLALRMGHKEQRLIELEKILNEAKDGHRNGTGTDN